MKIGGRAGGYRGPDRRASMATAGDGGYRGPDRRTRAQSTLPALNVPVAGSAALVLVLLVALGATAPWRALSILVLLRATADVLLLLAGAAQLLVWRLTGRAAPAFTGIGFVICGGLMLPLTATGYLVHTDPLLQRIAPGSAFILGAAGAGLCLLAGRTRSVVATLRPTREAGVLVLAALVALISLGVARAAVGPLDGVWSWAIEFVLLACGWVAAAARYARPSADAPAHPGLAAVAAGLAVSDGLLALGVVHHPTVAAGAMAVRALTAAWALLISYTRLERCLGRQGSRTLRLAGELGDTVQVLAHEQVARSQMLHDARSTLAAIRLANGTLTRYQEELDEMLQAELREAVGSELIRLEELLAHDHGRERSPLDLSETLAPVVRMARDAGLNVTMRLADLPVVYGRPVDTATVVQALLTNAAQYAGDGPIEVTARVATNAVQVLVSDRGPGIDPIDGEQIFQRGFRGRASDGQEGSGLGLFLGRWLMDEQEGSLQVEPRPGGGSCFVVTLPLADPLSSGPPGPVKAGVTRSLSAVPGSS